MYTIIVTYGTMLETIQAVDPNIVNPDPYIWKLLVWIIGSIFSILSGLTIFFLRKNINAVDELTRLLNQLSNKMTEQTVKAEELKDDVLELKTAQNENNKAIADLKLQVNEHDVLLNLRRNAN